MATTESHENGNGRRAPRRSPFAIRTLDVVSGSPLAKQYPGAHVIGRPFTQYSAWDHGRAKVDAIADRLVALDQELDHGKANFDAHRQPEFLAMALRSAVLSAHRAGLQKIVEFNAQDRYGHAAAAQRALRALSKLVDKPGFITAVGAAEPEVATEHPTYGAQVQELVRALDNVPVLRDVLVDARRNLKPVQRQNPGRPYMAGLIESLVTFWQKLTDSLPSKSYKPAEQSKSRRALFWDFVHAALADLSLHDEPVDHHIRSAIDRLQKQGERLPS